MYYDIYVIHTCLTLFNRKSRRKTGGTTTVLGSTRPATTSTPPTRFSETCSDEESLPNTLRKGTGSIASSETTFFPRSSKSWPDTRSLTKFQETRQLQDPTEGEKCRKLFLPAASCIVLRWITSSIISFLGTFYSHFSSLTFQPQKPPNQF